MWSYYLFPFVSAGAYGYFSTHGYSPLFAVCAAVCVGYLPTYLQTTPWSKRDGCVSRRFQFSKAFKYYRDYFKATLELEEPLKDDQLYIFCNFPHGSMSANHVITMTDCCGMLSKHYRGERRDLAASVLFFCPIVKELLLFLGCVDASAPTAHHNLKKNRSILIYIGGEKEQLMTTTDKQQIYLLNRKGFVKLALQYGAHLVPIYAFGENELYTTSNLFLDFRQWLQHNFNIGIPICYGRFGSLVPYALPIHVEIGKAIPVTKIPAEEITSAKIDELHAEFVKETKRLFDRTKVKYDRYKDSTLDIY